MGNQLSSGDNIKKLVSKLNNAECIAIAGHTGPDGDAVGACLALAISLKKRGKKVWVLLEDFNIRYSFIKGQELLYNGDLSQLNPDLFVALDCGGPDRLGVLADFFNNAPETVVIDHHLNNDGFGDTNLVEPTASSTCELVYYVVEALGNIDIDIATALYAGIIFDTGGLRHGFTGVETLDVVKQLMAYHIPFTEIYNNVLNVHSFPETRIFATALSKARIHDKMPVAYTGITLADLENAGANHGELDGIVEYLNNTRGMAAAVFAYEKTPGQFKISMRSKDVDINEIAGIFGGGGHKKAAGCSLEGPLEYALDKVLSTIYEKLFRN